MAYFVIPECRIARLSDGGSVLSTFSDGALELSVTAIAAVTSFLSSWAVGTSFEAATWRTVALFRQFVMDTNEARRRCDGRLS
jgi:hypothetical protein